MKTKAVRLYGKKDLRLEEFELPDIKEDEILAKVICDSLCKSSYKVSMQGKDHKRVPEDVAVNPVIIGHEFCGEILNVGRKWRDRFKTGDHFSIQPAHNKNGSLSAPGYSYPYCGGDATYVVIPPEIMEMDCLVKFDSDIYYLGALAEPVSCIVGAYNASYHARQGSYIHEMGIRKGGKLALLGGVGPMGLEAIDYAVNNTERRPSLIVVTGTTPGKLLRAGRIITPETAKKKGIELIYLNTKSIDAVSELMRLSGGDGYDDVFVFAPVKAVVEQGDSILAKDGCMNFFAGPSDTQFKAEFNFYNVHYSFTHIVSTSGGNNDDMREALELMSKGILNPTAMVTHIGGLSSAAETTLHLPEIPGGKKLIYNHIELPLTAIDDFEKKGKTSPLFKKLSEITAKNNGLWSREAEKTLLGWK